MLQKTNPAVSFLMEAKEDYASGMTPLISSFYFNDNRSMDVEQFARALGLKRREKARYGYGCGNLDIATWEHTLINFDESHSDAAVLAAFDKAISEALVM